MARIQHRVRTGIVAGLTAALVATLPMPGHAAGQPIPVANSGFETPAAPGAVPDWSIAFGTAADIQVVPSPVHSGTQAVRIVDGSTTEQRGLLSSPVPVTAGTTYQVGAWVRVEQGSPGLIVYYYDAKGARLKSDDHLVRTGPSDWVWTGRLVTAPEGAATARVMLFSAPAYVTTATWDDISLRPSARATEQTLGAPINAPNILDASYGVGPDGKPEVYIVTSTSPALFQVLDATTGIEKHRATLTKGAMGSWSILTASDGRVYIGVYNNGHLYRWDPASSTMGDLGRMTEKASYVWELEEDANGVIWGGSFPDSEVFAYDPAAERVVWSGSVSDEAYARSIAAAENGKIYAGTGSIAPRIVELDPVTHETREIQLPEAYRGEEFVYSTDARRDLLFVRLSPSSTMLVYDLRTERWIDDLGKVMFGEVSPTGPGGLVYYISPAGALMSYDIAKRQSRSTGVGGLQAARGFGWTELGTNATQGRTLTFMYLTGELNHVNVKTGEHTMLQSEAAAAPVKIQSVQAANDGKVYVGGYMYDGLSVFDPDTGSFVLPDRGYLGQVEGMFPHGNDLYIGTYTRANLFRYDTTKPWSAPGNPTHLASLHDQEQDRPFAWTAVGDTIATGTIPGYGSLGGAIALIDPTSNAVTTHRNVIPDQSIVSLTSIGSTVYGTTSIWGGIGAIPTAKSGVAFAWDPATQQVLWETVVNPSATAIQSIKAGPDGRLWVVDVGTLYELDPSTGVALRTIPLIAFPWSAYEGKSLWVGSDIEFDSTGAMYVYSRGTLFRAEPGTQEFVSILTGGTAYGITVLGTDVYLARTDQLVKVSLG